MAFLLKREIGFVAWGVGFLVGAGVRYGGAMSGHEESEGQGALAAGLAIGAVVLAKALVFKLILGRLPEWNGSMFLPVDAIWFGLATITAYKIGVGTYGSD